MSDVEENGVEDIPATNSTEVSISLTKSFNFSLNHRILPNCALSAVLEPKTNETLIAVTASNKIILKNNESSLNIRDKIKCVSTVSFGVGYEYLVVGTESQLVVFDFYHNSTVFQKEIPDGINCLAVGRLAERDLMIFCGGNCAIWGFDETGQDKYWTVTGDAVTVMCLTDFDGDGQLELIIGSPDNEIRVFKDDLMRSEIMETDAVIALAGVSSNSFVYALANGTLGLYRKEERIWRIKSKQRILTLLNFPLQGDMFTAVWANGKTDIRLTETGESLFSQTQDTSIQVSSAFVSQASNSNSEELTMVGVDGKVLGFQLESKAGKVDKTQETLRDFGQQKHNLLIELSNFEAEEQMTETEKERDFRIPANTIVEAAYMINLEERTLYLHLSATNQIPIRGVVAFAEGMFEGDSFMWLPEKYEGFGDEIMLPILPEKDYENDISVRVFLGHQDAEKLFVFECLQQVPRFARFAVVNEHPAWKMPESYVEFELKHRKERLLEWIQQMFVVMPDAIDPISVDAEQLEIKFVELAPKRELSLLLRYNVTDGKMFIYIDCIETATSMVQSMAGFFTIDTLTSLAYFPKEVAEVEEIVSEMDEMWEVRDRLSAELSDKQSLVKEIIVRAEDALSIDNCDLARKYYTRLRIEDQGVRQAFLLRSNNHERFVKSLRRLNKIIENASKLRVGDPSREIVAACREAISEDNKEIIGKIVQFGV